MQKMMDYMKNYDLAERTGLGFGQEFGLWYSAYAIFICAWLIKSFLGFTVDGMQKMADCMQKLVDLWDLKLAFFGIN